MKPPFPWHLQARTTFGCGAFLVGLQAVLHPERKGEILALRAVTSEWMLPRFAPAFSAGKAHTVTGSRVCLCMACMTSGLGKDLPSLASYCEVC